MTFEQKRAKLVKFFKTDYAFQSVVEQVEELTHHHINNVEEELVTFICGYDLEEIGAAELPPDEKRILILASFFWQYLRWGKQPANEFWDEWTIILRTVRAYVELKFK